MIYLKIFDIIDIWEKREVALTKVLKTGGNKMKKLLVSADVT